VELYIFLQGITPGNPLYEDLTRGVEYFSF
jgi:hypothetical protein